MQEENQACNLDYEASKVLMVQYKNSRILYDAEHPEYHWKAKREMVLRKIIKALEKTRPGTTIGDIKKIKNLRKQFSLEYYKILLFEKQGIKYKPSAWWYPYLDFLGNHFRPKNPILTVELETSDSDGEHEIYTTESDSEEVNEPQIRSSGNVSRKRSSQRSKKIATSSKKMTSKIIHEEAGPSRQKPIAAEKPAATDGSSKKFTTTAPETTFEPDRNQSLGNVMATQVAALKDDCLFYSTQMDLLNIINKAQLKQAKMNREASKK